MAVVLPYAPITRSHNQKRILSRNKGVKIKTDVNCKMDTPTLTISSGKIRNGLLAGVMSEKTPNIIFEELPIPTRTKKEKDPKKNMPTTTTYNRKSMRLLIRKGEKDQLDKYSRVPRSIEMPRTVEFFNGPPENTSDTLKILYLAGLDLCPKPDEGGFEYQKKLLHDQCIEFENCRKGKYSDTSIENAISSNASNKSEIASPSILLNKTDITSPIKITNKSEIISSIKVSDKTEEDSKINEECKSTWDVNMTVVITPLSQTKGTNINLISNLVKVPDNQLTPECKKPCDTIINEDDGWQSFATHIESEYQQETFANDGKSKFSIQEIEEAKIKLSHITKEWRVWPKGH